MTQAKDNLDNAVVDVCRSAQELIDNNGNSFGSFSGDIRVNPGDYYTLKTACDSWKKATQEFLSAAAEEPPCRTMKQLAEEAIEVQSASNLSGVIHSFSKVMTELRILLNKEPEFSTDKLNTHPICVLFSDKIASMTHSGRNTSFSIAYNWAKETIR